MRRADVVFGLVVSAVGIAALAMAFHMRFYAGGAPGPGFFPVVCSAALIVLGLVLAGQSMRPSGGEIRAVGTVAPVESRRRNLSNKGDEPANPMRSVAVWLGYAVCVPLLGILGFVPTVALLVAYLLFVVERRRGFRSLCAAVAVPIATYLLFVDVLGIQLPTGMLGLGVLGI